MCRWVVVSWREEWVWIWYLLLGLGFKDNGFNFSSWDGSYVHVKYKVPISLLV